MAWLGGIIPAHIQGPDPRKRAIGKRDPVRKKEEGPEPPSEIASARDVDHFDHSEPAPDQRNAQPKLEKDPADADRAAQRPPHEEERPHIDLKG